MTDQGGEPGASDGRERVVSQSREAGNMRYSFVVLSPPDKAERDRRLWFFSAAFFVLAAISWFLGHFPGHIAVGLLFLVLAAAFVAIGASRRPRP